MKSFSVWIKGRLFHFQLRQTSCFQKSQKSQNTLKGSRFKENLMMNQQRRTQRPMFLRFCPVSQNRMEAMYSAPVVQERIIDNPFLTDTHLTCAPRPPAQKCDDLHPSLPPLYYPECQEVFPNAQPKSSFQQLKTIFPCQSLLGTREMVIPFFPVVVWFGFFNLFENFL